MTEATHIHPLAAGPGTYSKHGSRFPGNAPRHIWCGEGPYAISTHSKRYVDLVASLGAVLLGHTDTRVLDCVQAEVLRGATHSLEHPLEEDVAAELVRIIPGIEQVRFCLNGSDAVNAAVRIARAVTNHDYVYFTGYHGFHDSYISTTSQCDGILMDVIDNNAQVGWDQIEALCKQLSHSPEDIAAIVVEVPALPWGTPADHITEQLLRYETVAHEAGALFILDEVVTGFREGLGGCQEKYGVTADLVCLGKALGNGYPIACLAGPEHLMRLVNPEKGGKVFMSATNAANTISLAAAIGVLDVLTMTDALVNLQIRGNALGSGLLSLFSAFDLPVTLLGTHARMGCRWHDVGEIRATHIEALWQQEMIEHGVLIGTGGIFPMTCYTAQTVQECLLAADAACRTIRDALDTQTVTDHLIRMPPPQIFRRSR